MIYHSKSSIIEERCVDNFIVLRESDQSPQTKILVLDVETSSILVDVQVFGAEIIKRHTLTNLRTLDFRRFSTWNPRLSKEIDDLELQMFDVWQFTTPNPWFITPNPFFRQLSKNIDDFKRIRSIPTDIDFYFGLWQIIDCSRHSSTLDWKSSKIMHLHDFGPRNPSFSGIFDSKSSSIQNSRSTIIQKNQGF